MVDVYQRINGVLTHIAKDDHVTESGASLGFFYDYDKSGRRFLNCTQRHEQPTSQENSTCEIDGADDPKTIFSKVDSVLLNRFKFYHTNNPEIYKLFIGYVNQLRRAGHKKYSAWAIINRIRWDHDVVKVKSAPFKIDNNFIGLYARLSIFYHPELRDFFILKTMKECEHT